MDPSKDLLSFDDITNDSSSCDPNASSANQDMPQTSDIPQKPPRRTSKADRDQKEMSALLGEKEELEIKVQSLEEQVTVLQEMLRDRDEHLVKLTNKIFEDEKKINEAKDNITCQSCHKRQSRRSMSPANGGQLIPPLGGRHRQIASRFYPGRDEEFESVKDALRAYKDQNSVINQEIVKAKEEKVNADQRVLELEQTCQEWEAKSCQIQSKLLSLLKEINQSITNHEMALRNGTTNSSSEAFEESTNEPVSKYPVISDSLRSLVTRLLNEDSLNIPLSWREGNRGRNRSKTTSSSRSSSNHDELGFYRSDSNAAGSVESMHSRHLDATLNKLKARNSDKLRELRAQNEETSAKLYGLWRKKWDDYVANLNENQLARSIDLKHLMRSGVPQEYRCKIWKGVIQMRIRLLRDHFNLGDDYYERLVNQKPIGTLSTSGKCYDPSAKQIELDLLRTLPNNKNFESLDSTGTLRLRRVLMAYSRHNPAVGYCQGLNRLAAVALLIMPEEDAFWCLVAIIETIMPRDYYSHNLLGAHVDQYVLKDMLSEKIPRLHSHLEQLGVDLNLFSWFLTCFVDNIPVRIYLRIWDVFLYEGSKVLFRFALGLLRMYEDDILKLNDGAMVNTFLRMLGERLSDDDVSTSAQHKSMDHPSETMNRLVKIAFQELNPFSIRILRQKRQHYGRVVKAELDRLDEIRSTLPSHQSNTEEAESEDEGK